MGQKPAVVIYRDHLLPRSETFVRAQGESLRRFEAYYVGSRLLTDGLSLPPERTIAVNRGGASGRPREALYRLASVAPNLYRRLRELDPVLIHAHFGPGGATALHLKRALQIPMAVTFHGFDATVKDEHIGRSLGLRVYLHRRGALQREADLFITVSEFLRQRIVEQGYPQRKTIVHYIGVDTDWFCPDPSVSREPIVLFVGRLTEKKGCEYLIDAMTLVQVSAPDTKLVVIGDGPLRADLERMAAEKLRSYAFLGARSPEEVRSWLQRATVFSVPSITAQSGDAEGFGLVFAEAQATGTPVASFASGGIPEAVPAGQGGLLAPERDWQTLGVNILRLMQDRDLWDRCSRRGRQTVVERFNLRTQTRRLEDIYTEMLEAHDKLQHRASPTTVATGLTRTDTQPSPRLGYLSAAPRVSTRPDAEASGPRAHVLGVIRAFETLGWEVHPFIAGDRVPARMTRGSESALAGSRARALAADVVRLGLGVVNSRRASLELIGQVDWVYERFAALQAIGWVFRRRGVPWILETQGPFYREARSERKSVVLGGLARRMELGAYRSCDALVCVSETLKELVVAEAGVDPQKVIVVPNGVDLERFDPEGHPARRIFGEEAFTVGFVGSLIAWQAVDVLLRAAAQLRAEGLHIHVVVVGDGSARAEWEALAPALGIGDAVRFTGRVSGDDVPGYIAGFDLAYSGQVPLKVGGMYHSPLKLYEYMAMRTPVVASAFADARSLVEGKDTGYLFAGGDVADLAHTLRRAYAERASLRDKGRAAREEIERNHSWTARVRDMITQLEAILDS